MMINKEHFWNEKILVWEQKRYSTSGFFRSSIYYRLKNAEQLLREVLSPNSRIVEFGCGSGRLAESLPESVDYLGIDFSEKAIKTAKARFSTSPNKKFEHLDVTQSKRIWKSNIIVGLGFIDWISEQELTELLSRCESQWVIFSYSKSSKGLMVFLYKIYGKYIFQKEYKPRFYEQEHLRSLLEKNNYTVKKEINSKGMLFGGLLLAEKKSL